MKVVKQTSAAPSKLCERKSIVLVFRCCFFNFVFVPYLFARHTMLSERIP